MGEARDSVVDKAQQGVQETMKKAQTVTHEAWVAAKGRAEGRNWLDRRIGTRSDLPPQ